MPRLQVTRRPDESVTILLPDGREIEVIFNGRAQSSAEIKLVFDAPADVTILRTELIGRRAPLCPRNVHTLREEEGSFRCLRCERLFDKRDGMLVERWSPDRAGVPA